MCRRRNIPDHWLDVVALKDGGKTTFALSSAWYAASVGGRVKHFELDGLTQPILQRAPKETRAIVDVVGVADIETLLKGLHYNKREEHPVVVVDAFTDVRDYARQFTRTYDFDAEKAGTNGEFRSAEDIVKRRPTDDQQNATSELEYAVVDAMRAVQADILIMTRRKELAKGGTYIPGAPFVNKYCDFRLELRKAAKERGPKAYKLRVRGAKDGDPDHFMVDPSFEKVAESYPALRPKRVAQPAPRGRLL